MVAAATVGLFLTIVEATITANVSVTVLVLLGVAATFQGVFDQKGISDLGKLVYRISLPSLLLVNIVNEVTAERLRTLWLLPAFCSIHVTLAYAFAKAASCLLRLDDVEERASVATIMFGNVGALAIAVLHGLCGEEPFRGRFGGAEHCRSKAVSFIAFYLITQNIWMFSWGERILFARQKEASRVPSETPGSVLRSADTPAATMGGEPTSLDDPLLADSKGTGRRGSHAKPQLVSFQSAPMLITVPSLTSMSCNEEPSVSGSRSAPSDPGSPVDPPSPLGREVHAKLTTEALQEVASRLALEVKPWAAMHHGGEAAIRAAMEVEEDDSELARSGTLMRSGSFAAWLGDRGVPARLRAVLQRARQRVWITVRHWSVRRTYLGTRRRCINLWRAVRSMLQNPPLQAACLALIVGLWPALKGTFVGEEAPMRSVLTAVHTLGQSQVPVSMLMLSGSGTLRYLDKQRERLKQLTAIEEGLDEEVTAEPAAFSFTRRAVLLMVWGRIIAIPCIGYVCWSICQRAAWLPDDPLIGFVLLIESAVPSAQNVVMLLLVHGELAQGAAMAEVILWQYAAAIPTFTVVASLFAFASLDG
eukprot:CAMPEP_0179072798 /NCGR_PEP_ID=MMETSP0796-20121207/32241_1 /TAXON_ID=73915 /ORGANISM="Pyrodinium bahamense, Strain pbaha01" /LENGTH=589 /DNA_ID=CAMNT_0020769971 /DNA_START=6 /DNA_END=1775 /DNA_ORIENTATION=+